MPKIIDFGLARATDQRLTEKTQFTAQGVILGTPVYMSPEQAGLDGLDIDMRSDVYTLGVLLYELLTGQLPFASKELRAAGWDAMCRTIREKDAPKPSTQVTTVQGGTAAAAKLRRTDAGTLLRRLRGDLDWIVLRCLEKDRTRRYETVNQLAEDVQRHLDHEPVAAHAPSFGYRLRKLVRRNRGPLTAAGIVALTVVGGLVGTTRFWLEARAQAQAAQTAREGESRKTEEALARKSEFDQLAGVVLYDRAIEAERDLYPPWPEKIDAMERWLRDHAGKLLAMRPRIEQTVKDLRERALPATPEEIERDRTSHPKSGEWKRQAAKLASLTRAQAIRNGTQELVLPVPTAGEQAMTPFQLNELAWPRVDSDDANRVWGEEARALALARLAWEKAGGLATTERAGFGDTLAWAWFANGKDTEALAQSAAALELAGDDEKEAFAGHLASLTGRAQAASIGAGATVLAQLRESMTSLEAEMRRYRFAGDSQSFLHDTLTDLLNKIGSLAGKERKAVGERLAWAQQIGALTLGHPKARVTWQAARNAIAKADGVVASELYRGQSIALRDEDVIGLVPIGMNPATKLWEFYELRSAWDGSTDPATIEIPR